MEIWNNACTSKYYDIGTIFEWSYKKKTKKILTASSEKKSGKLQY